MPKLLLYKFILNQMLNNNSFCKLYKKNYGGATFLSQIQCCTHGIGVDDG